MDFQYNVSRNYNRINFQNIFGMQFLPSALKEIYDAVVKRSYKDLILDFSGLEAAFADGMVPLCSYVRYIKEEYNVSIEYVAPNSLRLRACLETHLSIMKRFNSMLAMAI